MEAYVLKLKYLSHLTLVAFITFMAAAAPLRVIAQDDGPDDAFIPPSSNVTPPVIMDDSDSNSVNDVDEYDG